MAEPCGRRNMTNVDFVLSHDHRDEIMSCCRDQATGERDCRQIRLAGRLRHRDEPVDYSKDVDQSAASCFTLIHLRSADPATCTCRSAIRVAEVPATFSATSAH